MHACEGNHYLAVDDVIHAIRKSPQSGAANVAENEGYRSGASSIAASCDRTALRNSAPRPGCCRLYHSVAFAMSAAASARRWSRYLTAALRARRAPHATAGPDLHLGRYDEASVEAEHAIEMMGDIPQRRAALGTILASAGRKQEAGLPYVGIPILRTGSRPPKHRRLTPWHMQQ